MSVVNILRGHDLFHLLPVEDVDAISRFSSVKHFDANTAVFRCKAAVTHAFVLMEGEVQLVMPGEPPHLDVLVSTVAQGELFGLSSVLGFARYTLEARCRRSAEVMAIEAGPFVDLLQRRSLAGFQVMNHVARVFFARYVATAESLQRVAQQLPVMR